VKLFRFTFPFLLLAALLMAQKKTPSPPGLPPLIDRDLFFDNPEIAGAQLSPDGKYIAFMKPWKATMNIWVKKVDEPFSAARLLTAEAKRPLAGYLWSRDGKYVVFVKDNDGDENLNAYAVDPSAAPASGAEAPLARDLTGVKGAQIRLYSVPKNDPDIVFIGLNDRDKAWHDLYKLKLSTGEKTLVRQNTEKIASWIFDLNGQLRLAMRTADNGDTEILRVDPTGFTKVYSCSVFDSCAPVRFHKDGKRIYLETNKDADLVGLALFDPTTEKVEPVESDPLKRVDLSGAAFSEVTDELTVTAYREDHIRFYFKNKAAEADAKWLQGQLHGQDYVITSRSLDERYALVNAISDTEPSTVYLWDHKARKLTLQFKLWENLPREALAPMQPIRYKSSDGLEIPAYLVLPKGVPAKGLPTVVFPHGGPWARDFWGYNPIAQFLANRGYAVLMPNFRGSTGYGKKFLNAGNGEWGRKMQDDITGGVNYLISQGIADPKRVGIMGGSYGGYATLAGVAFTPDVYRAAVDIVGPSNLITLLEAIPPYWEAERKIMYARMADLNTPEGKAWMQERSPLHSAEKIKTPLMVVQGANDPRVNRREAEQIVVALRDRGFAVEYLLAADEGHGFARPINNLAMFMAIERFLAHQLDGRYQEGGTAESVARLKEITVDPKTVVITKPALASAAGTPHPVIDLQPGTYKYKASIALGAQQLALNLSTTIKEENGAWTAVDTIDTPAGAATDTATLEKGTLALRKRTVSQGPAKISVDYGPDKATGSINMGGKDTPISVDLPGPVFGDGPGGPQAIAALPLTEGYTASFRQVDLQKQKSKLTQLKVAGSESVTVPAGTFDSYRVELTSDEDGSKTTVWIAKQERKPVKVATIMAQLGGATMTAELVP